MTDTASNPRSPYEAFGLTLAEANTHALPWYVAPDYMTKGKSAAVLNSRGEQVAAFEQIEDARLVVERVNGGQS